MRSNHYPFWLLFALSSSKSQSFQYHKQRISILPSCLSSRSLLKFNFQTSIKTVERRNRLNGILPLYSSKEIDSNSGLDKKKKNILIDVERRSFLVKGLSVAATPFICSASPSATSAKEDLLLTDPTKIVMSMDVNNLPEKYASTNVSDKEEVPSNTNNRFCDAEMQRINVFEKAAPSVVYIDTYVEQRDAFSTNV